MDAVRLTFRTADGGLDSVDLDYAVVHAPRPRHVRVEPSDSPIFDQLVDEFWPPNYVLF